jgi:ABC-2 type transport system ATP-binding protein
MAVIEISGLRKEYSGVRVERRRVYTRRTVAVDRLDLSVPEGGVYGFLGPNGAGKTTTIRCLLGLVRPTAGTCRLLGADSQTELDRVVARVGSIVEEPAMFPTFSGRRNLELLARMYRIGPQAVAEMLDRVGLAERADDNVKTYSLGMRQRLGIAAALLKDPAVLILDEPANGLDPAGIKEVRELLRRLGDEGRTVFVSSHILSEVQQICDHVAILARGRCVRSGAVQEVLSAGRKTGLVLRLDDLAAGLEALRAAGIDASMNGGSIRVSMPPAEAATVTRTLAARRLYLTELRAEEVDLETVFLELTSDEGPEVPS